VFKIKDIGGEENGEKKSKGQTGMGGEKGGKKKKAKKLAPEKKVVIKQCGRWMRGKSYLLGGSKEEVSSGKYHGDVHEGQYVKMETPPHVTRDRKKTWELSQRI